MKKIQRESYKLAQALLIELRKNSGFTQNDLAENIGVDQSFISKVERGERRLDIIEFIAYCDGLNASPASVIQELRSKIIRVE